MTDGDGDGAKGDQGDGPPAENRDRRFFEEGTFNDWVGLNVASYGDGEAELFVEFEAFKQNPGGVMHGGVTATLVDVAGGMAIGSTLEEQPTMATTNLDVDYLRPVTDDAYATAEVVRVGSTTAIARVDVESTAPDGERKRVAIGTVTYQRR